MQEFMVAGQIHEFYKFSDGRKERYSPNNYGSLTKPTTVSTTVFNVMFSYSLFQKRMFGDKLHRFLWAGCPNCHPNNGVKPLKETQSN